MPWDGAQRAAAARVVATNRVTGQQISVDIGAELRKAIQGAIEDEVAQHPVWAARRRADHYDRTLMESSIIDVLVAIVAMVVTIISPDSTITGVLWLAAAALASKTLILAAAA
jgi:hypothetical protein